MRNTGIVIKTDCQISTLANSCKQSDVITPNATRLYHIAQVSLSGSFTLMQSGKHGAAPLGFVFDCLDRALEFIVQAAVGLAA